MTESTPTTEPAQPAEPQKSRKRTNRYQPLIQELDLEPLQTAYMDQRWLDQVEYMGARAKENQRKYRSWRVTGLVISLLVPALISLTSPEIASFHGRDLSPSLRVITIILSLVVSICAAIEQFFNYGERWRHFRRVSELLKIEGWSFIMLSEPYKQSHTHQKAFETFVGRVEGILKSDIDDYVAHVSQDMAKSGGSGGQSS